MEVWSTDFIYPLAGATAASALIGFEREFRGRAAGLRTHMLVCLTSTLLMLAAVHQVRWLTDTPQALIRIDPARMAHGVLTGIGFLCGGVIFRHGLSVHGLTTAASLWITSALGILYGVGFYELAIGGTALTLVVLALLHGVDRVLPRLIIIDVAVRYRRGHAPSLEAFRSFMQALGLACGPVRQRQLARGELIEIAMQVKSRRRLAIEALGARLTADPAVSEFDLIPRDE